MHPFDFPADVTTLTGDRQDYFAFINSRYFSICQNQKVLEIGPFNGDHSKLIAAHQPSYFECVEGDPACKTKLESIPGIGKVTIGDIWLKQDPQPFDVVICFGVLYHHHSPLHLLELLVNLNAPNYILLDCVTAEHPLAFIKESTNIAGTRQIIPGWKHCGINLKAPFFIINQSLDNMGYNLVQAHKLQCNYFPKSNGWVALWELKENQ
jgi:hypothetical protein